MGESKDKVKVDRKDKGKQVEPSGSSRLHGPPAITTTASYQSSSSIYDSPGPSSRSTPIATPSTVTTPSTAGFGGDETPYHLRDEETPPDYPGDRLEGQEAEGRNRRFTFIPSVDKTGFIVSGPGLDSEARMGASGKIDISLKLKGSVPGLPTDYAEPVVEFGVDPNSGTKCPALSIVIFIVGSRGDVQPYIALALELIKAKGHRVRIATHGEFKDLVLSANSHLRGLHNIHGNQLEGKLEFFDVGGDPKELMAYMVKNPGLLPGFSSITNGDVGSKRKMTKVLLKGFYNSTFFPDSRNGPFAADAIISNPPAFAHVHIAEALGLPLHMTFTMPWSPTVAFSHPLTNVKQTNAEPGLTNYLSFAMADMLMWQGLGDLINTFRTKTLGLSSFSLREGPSIMDRLKVPWTYCWSEGLIPKPKDWKQHIDISGFYFLEGETNFRPAEDLVRFIQSGPAPIYIGFGSVPVKDPAAMTNTIFSAVQKAGVRAVVSAGWGGLGGLEPSKDVYNIKGNIPHDWLFADGRVAAVCHHGGAGTTAIALRNGLPTIVVPFFGDQQFWGDMIHNAGAGPSPISPKNLNVDTLAEAISVVFSPEAQTAARTMGQQIRSENGVEEGVDSFHRHLPLLNMWCELDSTLVAHWWSDSLALRLSGAAAALLVEERKLTFESLKPHRSKEWDTHKHPTDPGTGSVQGIFTVLTTSFVGVGELFYAPHRGVANLTFGVAAAAVRIVGSLQEGFENLPKSMGSDYRHRTPIKTWKDGFSQAGSGFAYGLMDGITGLVTEPIVGAHQDGVKGVAKGMGRSLANLFVRPIAGSLGLFTLPVTGIYRSVAASMRRQPEKVLFTARKDNSISEYRMLSQDWREATLAAFTSALKDTKKRKRRLRRRATRFLLTGQMVNANLPRHRPKDRTYDPTPSMDESAPPMVLSFNGPDSDPEDTEAAENDDDDDLGYEGIGNVAMGAIPTATRNDGDQNAAEAYRRLTALDEHDSQNQAGPSQLPPPDYAPSQSKSEYVAQLDRHNSLRETVKREYMTTVREAESSSTASQRSRQSSDREKPLPSIPQGENSPHRTQSENVTSSQSSRHQPDRSVSDDRISLTKAFQRRMALEEAEKGSPRRRDQE